MKMASWLERKADGRSKNRIDISN